VRINLYAQNRNTLVIDGVVCNGFKEGDWMQIKKEGNAATRTHGGDGPSMNLSTDQGGQLTFGFNPTSPVLGIIYQLREQQKSAPRLFSVQLITGVEEVISCVGCAYGEMPQFTSGGDKMTGRDIMIEALEINLDTSAVEAISGSALGGLV
jgi:hypothetical protein